MKTIKINHKNLKDLEKDIIATEKLVDKIKNKLMIKADPTKTTHAPSSQSELIKKHNKNIRKTKKKMLKVKGGY